MSLGNKGLDMAVSSPTAGRSGAKVEWPTLLLIVLCWLAYGLLTWFWQDLRWWILAPLGGYVLCFYGSLQHEAVHGHPTRSALLNEALVHLPIGVVGVGSGSKIEASRSGIDATTSSTTSRTSGSSSGGWT